MNVFIENELSGGLISEFKNGMNVNISLLSL
jgi:hypothetical protein